MQKRITTPPPNEFKTYSPSQLFKFFFQLGRWTEESFSADFQIYTRGTLISSVTINKWKNHDVIPTRYAAPLFKLIENSVEPKIATAWTQAFEIVWATHIARFEKATEKMSLSQNHKVDSDAICEQHCQWIRNLYDENIFGENFSTRDIYVPLQLVETGDNNIVLYENDDLLNLFTFPEQNSWTCISGVAGSGKSMLALHLAQKLSHTATLPIYLRGKNISDIEIDIQDRAQPVIDAFSAGSFLKHFRISSQKTACLILDGIDEIIGTHQDVQRYLSDLHLQQNICEAQGKVLSVVIFAREADPYFMQPDRVALESRHLRVLSLNGHDRSQKTSENLIIGEDKRPLWWTNYLSATGRKLDNTLPDFLCLDYADFQEFSSVPLWTYLICKTAIDRATDNRLLPHEAVNKFTYSENTNIIYRTLVNYITHKPDTLDDISRLQNLALTHWHCDLNQNKALINEPHKDRGRAFDFETYTHSAGLNLKREDKSAIKSHQKELIFYLLATLIVDRFIALVQQTEDTDEFEGALRHWSILSGQGIHDPILADFCQKEISLRFTELGELNWDKALPIALSHLNINHFQTTGLDAAAKILESASLLRFIWSCFNLERYKNTGVHFKFSDNPKKFNSLAVRRIHQSNFLNFKNTSLINPALGQSTLLTPSLSALHLTAADLSQLSFSAGHMESIKCEKSSFAMTHWSHVKISNSSFRKSTFQQAIFHGSRWHKSEISGSLFQGTKIETSSVVNCTLTDTLFSQCSFSDVDFLSCIFRGVIFDRCIFRDCGFKAASEDVFIDGIEFRYCTFLSMEKSVQRLIPDRLVNCVIQSVPETPEILTDKFLSE